MGRLSGKVVAITGASSGLGAVLAAVCAGEGARLSLFARNAEKLAETARACQEAGGEVLVVVGGYKYQQ